MTQASNQARFPSHVALPEATRSTLIAILNAHLASTIDLMLQSKQAHWNIKGPQFFARHQLFDKLSSTLREQADTTAERVSTLGGYAEGTVRQCVKGSSIPEYDLKLSDGQSHLRALAERYGIHAGRIRETIPLVAEMQDPVTEDLLIEQLKRVELDMWFLDSHLHV